MSITISASTLGVTFSALFLALFDERVNRKPMIISWIAGVLRMAEKTATPDPIVL